MAERVIPFNQLAKAGYNRGINRAHVNKIKRNFHEDMVQPAIVSFRDGAYYIIDHQHQTQAIYELNDCDPNTPIRCDVRTGLTYEQEADLYYRLNTSTRSLGFADKLKGLIESKDAIALDFRFTVESCGYIIGGNTNNSLNALSTAWKIFSKQGGKEKLTAILSLAHACWPNEKNGVHTSMIDGISLFIDHHGDVYQREQFVRALSDKNPSTLINDANTFYKSMDSKQFTRQYCMYTLLAKRYNYKLRSNKLRIALP